jgi:methyl-accepting chemotaxis protein
MALIFLAGFYYIQQIFQPIYNLKKSVLSVTANSLNEYIPVKNQADDLSEIAINYNGML